MNTEQDWRQNLIAEEEESRKRSEAREGRLINAAVGIVETAGGSISFDDYDAAIADDSIVLPMHFIVGYGLPATKKKIGDGRLAAALAVSRGLLENTGASYVLAGGAK